MSLAISLSINILMHVTCVITARTFVGVSAINLSVSITSVLADRLSSRFFTSVTLEEDIRSSSPMNLFSTSGCIRFLEIDLRFRVPRKQRRLDAQIDAACSPAREFKKILRT